jgi:hypothetical protein
LAAKATDIPRPYNVTVRGFMSKVLPISEAERKPRARVALLSNPRSEARLAQLPRIRAFCAEHPDVFHYEVEDACQVGEAMKSIARVRPSVLAINGCDGTLSAARAELGKGHFLSGLPLLVVLASGKLESLEQVIEQARTGALQAS